MAKRRKMPKRRDKKVFRTGATNTKTINVNPAVMRGGIRL